MGTEKGIYRIESNKTPKLLIKKADAPSPVALTGAGRLLCSLGKDRKRFTLLRWHGGSKFSVQSRHSLTAREVERITAGTDARTIFFASHSVDAVDDASLDGLDAESGALRRGPLPDGSLGLRFENGGHVGFVVNPRRRTRAGEAQVELWTWGGPDALERKHSVTGELLEAGTDLCLVKSEGLKLLDRTSGEVRQLKLPEELADKDMSLQHRFLVVSDDETHTVFNVAGERLGAWRAINRTQLALAPNGLHVVRVASSDAGNELICEAVGGGVVWRKPHPVSTSRVEISADALRVVVSGVCVRDLASGEVVFELKAPARFSRDGKFVLVDQFDRYRAAAGVVHAETGKQVGMLSFAQARARVTSGLQLLAVSRDGKQLVVRRHSDPRKGLWLYTLGK